MKVTPPLAARDKLREKDFQGLLQAAGRFAPSTKSALILRKDYDPNWDSTF